MPSASTQNASTQQASNQKALGAFYTDAPVATFLVRWAVRNPQDVVLDPSFGGGIFLEVAAHHLTQFGGSASTVYGVEVDAKVHQHVSENLGVEQLGHQYGVPANNLICADFFACSPANLPSLDALVGNPPFIRFQQFAGDSREQALARCAEQGVTLSKLASSWAAFLIHGTSLLKPGGRLAMVIPSELTHAPYARPVLEHLLGQFAEVSILTFVKPLFPELSQDTLLLLADAKGGCTEKLGWRELADNSDLEPLLHHSQNKDDYQLIATNYLEAAPLLRGQRKLRHHAIDPKALELYEYLASSELTYALGNVAEVGIGYVTGANKFFHVDTQTVANWQLPASILKPAVFRAKALRGVWFGEDDWHAAVGEKLAGWLVHLEDDLEHLTNLSEDDLARVESYLEHGQQQGVANAYKCRIRKHWYCVPNVRVPDGLLTYMSGLRPQLVHNVAPVVTPNTLHNVRLNADAEVDITHLAATWQTSLTALSVELEGHALGGGMLKLEPSEAANVHLARVTTKLDHAIIHQLDDALRDDRQQDARSLADRVMLQEGLGLSAQDCELLAEAAMYLSERRYYRGRRVKR
ncbi:MAG: N-6 DNA methylase [Deinococcota bacterium]